MKGKKIAITVFDSVENKIIIHSMSLKNAAASLGIKYKSLSNARVTGRPIQKRYHVYASDTCIEPVKEEREDDYALEWELKEYCKKLREQVGTEILCGIGLHGITEEGQIVR